LKKRKKSRSRPVKTPNSNLKLKKTKNTEKIPKNSS
jgi:hypothetical protein